MRWNYQIATVGVLVLLVATAGCSDLVPGEGELEFSAAEATVSDDALSETGFNLVDVREHRLNRTVTIGNETRNLDVTNHVAAYRSGSSDTPDDAADVESVFGVLSTPQAEVFGQPINPLGHLSQEAIMRRAISEAESIENLQEERTTTVTMLGNETDLVVYAGTMSKSGQTVDVTAYVARVSHGDDFVIAAGVHRADAPSGQATIETLIEGITHESGE